MTAPQLTANYAALLFGLLCLVCLATFARIWSKGITAYYNEIYLPASQGKGTRSEYFIYIITLILLSLAFGSGASLAFAYANGITIF